MTTIDITADKLPAALRANGKGTSAALKIAAIAAARRFVPYLAKLTDDMGITDRGIFKAGWKAEKTARGASVSNDTPYAGVIELGARPHAVSPAARQLLKEWAIRKLGVSAKEADGISWAIAHKIAQKGQAPTYMVRDAMPHAAKWFAEEFARVMRNRSAKAAG